MKLSINNLSNNKYNTSLNSSKENKRVSEVSFRGDDSAKNINNIIYAAMILASLGLGSCKNSNNSEISKTPTMITDDRETPTDFLPLDYEEDIKAFMEDDKVVNITSKDTIDANYDNDFRVIYAKGFDKNGKLVKSMEIHPFEPIHSDKEPLYCPEPEYKNTVYYSDKKITQEYDNGEFMRTEIVYNKPVTLDGVNGYKKINVITPDGAHVDIYTKGKTKLIDNVRTAVDGKYHERQIMYDKDNNKLGFLNYKTDSLGHVVLDEDNSDLPSDF